jgi:hypothetical protein
MSSRSWRLPLGLLLGGPVMLMLAACGGDDTTGAQPSAGSSGAGLSDASGGHANGGAAGSAMGVGGSDASSGVGGSALNDGSKDASDASIEASKDAASDRTMSDIALDVTEAGVAGFCGAVSAAHCPSAPDPTDCGRLFSSACPAAQACASCAGSAPTIGCLDGGLGFTVVGCETFCAVGPLSACVANPDAGNGDASTDAVADASSDRVTFDVSEAGVAGFCAAVSAAQCPNAPDPTDCGKLFTSACPAAQACASCAGPAPTIGCLDGGLGFSVVGCETLCNIGQLSACQQGQDAGGASIEAGADASGDRVTSDVAFDVTEAGVAAFCSAVGAAQCPNAPDPTDCGKLFTSDCAAAQACASCAGSAPTINCLDGGLGFTVVGCETLCAVGQLSVCFPGQDAGDASVE